jgi:predicted nucleic acid-binding protein
MKYVLDASVALKWCLSEANVDNALKLRAEFETGIHDLAAPDLFPVEIAHALSKASRQRRISDDEAKAHYFNILTTPPRLFPVQRLLDRAFQLSLDLRVPVYDCLYVALAEELNCQLVTADSKAVRTFQGLPVVDLASI